MRDQWEEQLACAITCPRCEKRMGENEGRILSVYDHHPVCLACKKAEETREDYAEASKEMIGQCLAETEVQYADPGGYCFHHFYPWTCGGPKG